MSKLAAAGRGGTCLQSRDLEDEEGGPRVESQPGLPSNTWPLAKQILLQMGGKHSQAGKQGIHVGESSGNETAASLEFSTSPISLPSISL